MTTETKESGEANESKLRQPIVTVCGHVDHGKCVAGETLIHLADGRIKRAKEIFEENFIKSRSEKIDDGIFQDISGKNVEVFSFDGKSVVRKPITHIWMRKAEKLIEIGDASGNLIKTTPEHPFLIFEKNSICERRADQINCGDYVAFPAKIRTSDADIRMVLLSKLRLLGNFICFFNEKFNSLHDLLKKSNMKKIGLKLGIKNLSNSLRNNRLRLRDFFAIVDNFGLNDYEAYSMIGSLKNSDEKQRAGHTSKELSFNKITDNLEGFGYLLGCIAGDGHITKTNVILNNNDADVQEAYISLLDEIFLIKSKVEQGHTCQIVRDGCGRTFSRFISEVIGIPQGNKSGIVEVPEVAQMNKEVFRGFLSGLFDTDGYVSKLNNSIEITSKSKLLIKQCSMLLLNFGVLSSFYEKKGFFVLKISNKEYLNKFLENFRPRLKRKLIRIVESAQKAQSSRIFDIVPIDKEILKKIKLPVKVNKLVPYFNKYIKSQNLTRSFLLKTLEYAKNKDAVFDKIADILNSEIRIVKVVSKNEISNPQEFVYDFTISGTHNFIAERVIVHNTSILDAFRGSSIQEGEAGGITQKISFTKYPIEKVKASCPLVEKHGIKLDIPGYLFIDTPGHAAFTNLRKRGGALADLAILVVSIKEGIKPQTAEVLQILKANKVPFVVALNKVDSISGWTKRKSVQESIENASINVRNEFEEALLTFQGSLSEHGFDSDLFYNITDFTKKIALVPTSARTGEGISELLFVLCGLSQKFLKEKLKIGDEAKGVILEVKKGKGMDSIEAILYDGELKEGDEVAIASFGEPIVTKIRAIEEILPLSFKYKSAGKVIAATGVKLQLKAKEGVLSGMPFQTVSGNLEKIKSEFKKEVSGILKMDKQGIIVKAESLGSLEALLFLLKNENIQVIKADIGTIGKSDVVSGKANLDINPLDAVILGFNVELEEGLEKGNVKIITNNVIFKLIDDLKEWRTMKSAEIEKEKLLGLATICKLEILPQYVFRNSNPAVFGVKVIAGKVKVGIPLMDNNGEEVARVKSLQQDKASVQEATAGTELAMGLPGINFERRLKETKYLYAYVSDKQMKAFKENKELLSADELKVLQEIADIKAKMKLKD